MCSSSRLLLGIVLAVSAHATLPNVSVAGLVVTEVESNNRFSLRQQLPGGVTEVRGTLGSSRIRRFPIFRSMGARFRIVDFYSIPGQTPGTPFFSWTDNRNSGVDTYLGTFGTNGVASTLIDSDDDGGDGLASALEWVCQR